MNLCALNTLLTSLSLMFGYEKYFDNEH